MKCVSCLFLLFSISVMSQITGTVVSEENKKLSNVSVYLEGTTLGTSTNDNGFYKLPLDKKGSYTLIFQYLGYKTIKKSIKIAVFPHVENSTMKLQDVVLEKVVIGATKNPAIAIIKNAVRSREKNTAHLNNFTADFYSKGLTKIKNAPKKILGQELSFPFPLDSTRSGIVYLSETISKITSQQNPKKFKEKIIGSKISGKDNGVSFNQAAQVNFDIYKNTININDTDVISPISSFCFNYYSYKLIGTFYDIHGNLINKIQLTPKLKTTRCFKGFVYIVEEMWSVYGSELITSGKQLNTPFLKELTLKQNYKFNKKDSTWNLLIQTIDFSGGLFGVNVNGRFTSSYKNYNLKPVLNKKTFTNEVLSFSRNATKKDSIFWKKTRPVPLTTEEETDYVVKDSIKVIVSSKKYLDSVDRKRNKLKFSNLIFGYRYKNSFEKWSINVNSPLALIDFNTIQGYNTKIGGSFIKRIGKLGKLYQLGGSVNYGFSDKALRHRLYFGYKWNNFEKPTFVVTTGNGVFQFDEKKPISRIYNSITSLYFKRNFMKVYEKKYVNLNFNRDVFNGIRFNGLVEYAQRNPLKNTSNYSHVNNENRVYTSNNPVEPKSEVPSFTSHNIWKAQATFRIRFFNKYNSYPDRKIDIPNSNFPELSLRFRSMFGAKNKKFNSNLVAAKLTQNIKLSTIGNLSYYMKGSMFLQDKEVAFMDYIHPNANQTWVTSTVINKFKLLEYYSLSTNKKQGEVALSHDFKGFILNKIPLINKLNFNLNVSGKSIFTPAKKVYSEYSVGLSNVGFGSWRLLRVDYVRSYFGNNYKSQGVVVGLNFEL